MGINVYQVGVFNTQMFGSGGLQSGSYASEFPLAFDNINASGSRLVKIMGSYASVDNQDVFGSQSADSWGQPTGMNNNNNTATPCRPNGGYFIRGLWFSNTAFAPSPNRNGYVGSFVSGVSLQGGQFASTFDFAHDLNAGPAGGVDYEPLYSHGVVNPPTVASLETQWRDGANQPSDGADLVQNFGSAYTRTAYMPPSTFLLNVDSVGAQTIGAGTVSFHIENRPSLRVAGYSDGNPVLGSGGSNTGSTTIQGQPGPYGTDPQKNTGNPLINAFEYYQASGTRPLNSRGLSLHLAKVMDNWWSAYGYVYEEDGVTLAPNAHTGGGGHPIDLSVNAQQEYLWQRDQACNITSISNNGTVASLVTTPNTFSIGQVVYITGLSTFPNYRMNGQFYTILPTGFSSTGFQVNFTTGAYGSTPESPYGYAVFNPDSRVRQAATFNINEEYYGLVMDTKCTIWSNKATMIPLLFFDLATKWTSSTAPRIAGVSVVPVYINATQTLSYQIFFLSEDGFIARYDFTQLNGVLELAGTGSFTFASNAPAVAAAGEAYGAMQTKALTAPITATSVTANVLTVTCANHFQAGDVVNITGTEESFLNNQTVTVLSSGLSTSQFEANYTTANYTNGADTGSAVGYQVWALYGTMTPDPRTTQTGLANTANINLYKYSVGTGTWSSKISSTLTGRHNGRSLSEFIVKRDGRIYILCEDVTSTAGFIVANTSGTQISVYWQVMCYDPITAAWNTSKVNGGATPLQYGVQGTVNTSGTSVSWVSGTLFAQGLTGQPFIINGVQYTVSSFSSPTSINLTTSAGTQSGVSYNWTNMGPVDNTTNFTDDFWFYNINAFMHDVAPNSLLIQPNWSAGSLQILDTTGAPALTNTNLTPVAGLATLFAGYGIITSSPYFTYPDTDPVTIIHNSDYTVGGDRTIFLLNFSYYNPAGAAGSNPATSLFYAPPSYNWATPTALLQMLSNPYTSGGPNNSITAFNNDNWSFQFYGNQAGATFDHIFWLFPTQVRDNYIHFVRNGGGADGYPSNGTSTGSTYGKSFGQMIGYLPTYWKWTGSAWAIADSHADAVANPYTVPAYGTGTVNTVATAVTWVSGNLFFPAMVGNPITINGVGYTVLTYISTTSITLSTSAGTQSGVSYVGSFSPATPLPYGLQVQWGPTPSATYSQNEFQTFNVAVGNTKYTRKGRFSWAMFAGQTFLNSEPRNVSDENAMSINFIDTDIMPTPTFTAPTSATPNTAPLVNPAFNNSAQAAGWNTQVTWPKLDGAHAPYDATPFVMNLVCSGFNQNTWIIPPAYNPSGNENDGSQNLTPPGVNPWTWTVGANTYVSSESQRSPLTGGGSPSVAAWSGNPQAFWAGGSYPCWNMIDLGTGNTQSCLSYTFRTVYDGSDSLFNNAQPTSYQLQASNNGTFTDNGGGPFIIDDRTGGNALSAWKKGMAFNCNGGSAGTPFRYYRWYAFSGGGNGPAVGMIRLNSAVMTTSVNFTDLTFLAYGSQDTSVHFNPLLRDWQWARGLKIEVSTNNGGSYSTIMEPNGTIALGTAALWRSHQGNIFSFPRQVGVTNIRVTVQQGYNMTNASGNVAASIGFGPFYLMDYGTQTQLNTARLGTNGTQGSPTQVSWDYNSLGVATDVMSISIDGNSPNMFVPYSTLQDYAVFGFWDFGGVPSGTYKVHPFYGFLLFPGAGGDAGRGIQTGTSAVLQYQWGRRA